MTERTITYYDAKRNKIEGIFDVFVLVGNGVISCGVAAGVNLDRVKALRYVNVRESKTEFKWYTVEYKGVAPRTQSVEFSLTKEPASVFITETDVGEIVKVKSRLYPETVYPEERVGGNLGKDTGQDITNAVHYLIAVGCSEVHFSIRGGFYSACGFKQFNGTFQFIDYSKVSNEFKNLLRDESMQTLKDSVTLVEYLLEKIDIPKVPFKGGWISVSEFIVVDSDAREAGIETKVRYLQDIDCDQIHVFRRRNSTGYCVAGIKNGKIIDMCKDSNEVVAEAKIEREITGHMIYGNEPLKVESMDVMEFNAHHSYQISVREGYNPFYSNINFQKGPVKENGHNGVTETALLAVLIDRLQCFQNSEFKCKENAVALTHLEDAMNWLNRRTIQRTLRNVEGTNQK